MKRSDVDKVLIIGSGPIVSGQACEFDYSGTQACKALRACGYKVVLVNSNPATIMTDPVMADATYIEPLNEARLEQIIEKERPDAILPNLGGQTGLNLSMELAKKGILEKYGVKVIGVNLDAIERGEDREVFKATMEKLGIETPRSGIVHTVEEAVDLVENKIGYPVVVRPAYTMGGSGGGFCYNIEELRTICMRGLDASKVSRLVGIVAETLNDTTLDEVLVDDLLHVLRLDLNVERTLGKDLDDRTLLAETKAAGRDNLNRGVETLRLQLSLEFIDDLVTAAGKARGTAAYQNIRLISHFNSLKLRRS